MTGPTVNTWSEPDHNIPYSGAPFDFHGGHDQAHIPTQSFHASQATLANPSPIQSLWTLNTRPSMDDVEAFQQYLAQTRPRSAPIPQINATPRMIGSQSMGLDISTASTADIMDTWTDISVPNSATQSVFDFSMAQNHPYDPASRPASGMGQHQPEPQGWFFDRFQPVTDTHALDMVFNNFKAPMLSSMYQPSFVDPFTQAVQSPQQITPSSQSSSSRSTKPKKPRCKPTTSKRSVHDTPLPNQSVPYQTPQWIQGREYGFGNPDALDGTPAKFPRPSCRLSNSFGGPETSGSPISPLTLRDQGLSAYRAQPDPNAYEDERSRRASRAISGSTQPPQAYPTRYDLDKIIHEYLQSPQPPSRHSSGDSENKKSPGQRADARGKTILSRTSYERLLAIVLEGRQDRLNDPDVGEFKAWIKQRLVVVLTDGEPVLLSNDRPIATVENFYDVLTYCHGVKSHAGRDKTHAEITKFFAGVPKEITAEFVKSCPTCRAKKTRTASDHPEEIFKILQFAVEDPIQGGPKGTMSVLAAKALAYREPGYKPAPSRPNAKETTAKTAPVARFHSAKEDRSVRTVGNSSTPIRDPVYYEELNYAGALGLHTGLPQLPPHQQPEHQDTAHPSQTVGRGDQPYDFALAQEMQREESLQSWSSSFTDENGAGASHAFMSQSASLESLRAQVAPEAEIVLDDEWHRQWVAENAHGSAHPPSRPSSGVTCHPAPIDTRTAAESHHSAQYSAVSSTASIPDTLAMADWTYAQRRTDSFMSVSSADNSSPEDKGKGKAHSTTNRSGQEDSTGTGISSAPSEESTSGEAAHLNLALTEAELEESLSWLKAQEGQSGDVDTTNVSIDELWKSLQGTPEAEMGDWKSH